MVESISSSRDRLHIVIHGGMHKTGTTSLQYLFATNRAALLKEGICYPSFQETHHRIVNMRRPDWDPSLCLNALDEARQSGARKLVLSSEVVSILSAQQLRKLSACFSAHDLTYVFCFRHWHPFFRSRWTQNCARRDSQTFRSYVETVIEPDLGHPDYRYDLIMDRAVSTGNSVVALSYDNAIAADGSIVPAVLRAAGFPDHLISRLAAQPALLNSRGEPGLLEICRLLNGIIAERRQLPQDDLCRSVAQHRQCRAGFDLLPKIRAAAPDIRSRMTAAITSFPMKVMQPPDVSAVMNSLWESHGHRFANAECARIFPDPDTCDFSYRDLSWQRFRDVLGEPFFSKLNWLA